MKFVAFPQGYAERYEAYTLGLLEQSCHLVEAPELSGWRVWASRATPADRHGSQLADARMSLATKPLGTCP